MGWCIMYTIKYQSKLSSVTFSLKCRYKEHVMEWAVMEIVEIRN
jgi:hypothetical protein